MTAIFEKTPPVKVGDNICAGIVGYGEKGNPYVKVESFIVYIENYKEQPLVLGKPINLRIIKVCKRFAFANVVQPTILSRRKNGRK